MGTQPQGVGHGLEREAVLLDPGIPKVAVVAPAARGSGGRSHPWRPSPTRTWRASRSTPVTVAIRTWSPVAAYHAPHRVGDVGRLDQPGGQLVQQRLEQVVVVLLQQRHPHRRLDLGQGLDRGQPGEPTPTTTTCGSPSRFPAPAIDQPPSDLIVQPEYARYGRHRNSWR